MFGKRTKPKPLLPDETDIGHWRFQWRRIEEYTGTVNNLFRGWYRMYTFKVDCKPDFSQLKWCSCTDERLALLRLDLGAYRDSHIINSGIENIRKIFSFFISCGKDLIVRFTYDIEGKGLEHEPASSRQIQGHMNQLGVVIKEFHESIFCLQGLFIGSWGEMHHSAFLSEEDLKELAEEYWRVLKCPMFLSVRSPQLWRTISHKRSPRHLMRNKVGLFDDALFASPTHLGTFAEQKKDTYDELEKWDRDKELDFEEDICQRVPNGGEALLGEEGKQIGHVIETMRKMHLTYLNCEYDEDILTYWKETTWEGESPNDKWRGRTVYNYIEDHLGYRFVIRDMTIKKQSIYEYFKNKEDYRQGALRMEVTIENIGFASFYHKIELFFVVEADSRNVCSYLVTDQLNELKSGMTKTYSCLFMPENGHMYLKMNKLPNNQPILFANQSFRIYNEDGEKEMVCRKGMNQNTERSGLLMGRMYVRPEGEYYTC